MPFLKPDQKFSIAGINRLSGFGLCILRSLAASEKSSIALRLLEQAIYLLYYLPLNMYTHERIRQ